MAAKAKTKTKPGKGANAPKASALAGGGVQAADKPLTEKQATFVREYLVDLNATQAAIRAGYSASTAHSIGNENLSKPAIAAAVASAQAERSRRTEITQDNVLEELRRMAFFDPRRLFSPTGEPLAITDLDDDVASCIGGIDIVIERTGEGSRDMATVRKYKVNDKQGPLKLLGQHVGLFKRQLELTGKDGAPIQTQTSAAIDMRKLSAEQLEQLEAILAVGGTNAAADPGSGKA